ncbi:NADPH:quinone reductase-like Zn-dependent oxidoreductase, partial [Streptacidiphilus sp. MAP12-16]|uniref:NADP-dependent oxidoreductase n=1 Tax=Streptacidiphilus sp. MAP12-16 TaxID=3156300 RepID=UPI00351990E2
AWSPTAPPRGDHPPDNTPGQHARVSIEHHAVSWDSTWTDSFDGTGKDRLPTIPSHEVSGVVAGIGEDVEGFAIGQSVYGLTPFTRDGAAAEFVVVPAASIAPKPVRIDHDQAAAVPLAGLTAWQGLVKHARISSGQRVLVHGGAGGVGSFAVQMAAALGAQVVATAAQSDASLVRNLGADWVVDYVDERFEEELHDVDIVFDTVGADTQNRSWQVMRPGGVLVSIVQPPDPERASQHGVRGEFFVVEPDPDSLTALTALINADRISPLIDRVMPLDQAPAAYEALEKEHRRGKIVLHVSDG